MLHLHEGLEVVVSIHLLHIVSQHFITEEVVILVIEKGAVMRMLYAAQGE